ncbi:mRNA triphosphatase CET1, partial [Saccharata proteae CBS 121410]
EPNFQNLEPWDDVTRQVCDFLWNHIISREDLQLARSTVKVEVEGKLGTLVDKDTNQRLELPVASQCVLTKPVEKLAFKSFMNENQHKHLNKCLNEEVAKSIHDPRRAKIQYEHLRETDSFHKLSRESIGLLPPVAISYLSGQNRNPRVRISQDSKTKQIKARIIKARVADLDIYSPREAFDCRISINVEIECPEDVGMERSEDGPRVKDRMSYKHQNCQIDLTQVSQADPNSAKTHELEVELGTDALIDQGNLAKQNVDNAYEDLVKQFVSNIRVLSR